MLMSFVYYPTLLSLEICSIPFVYSFLVLAIVFFIIFTFFILMFFCISFSLLSYLFFFFFLPLFFILSYLFFVILIVLTSLICAGGIGYFCICSCAYFACWPKPIFRSALPGKIFSGGRIGIWALGTLF